MMFIHRERTSEMEREIERQRLLELERAKTRELRYNLDLERERQTQVITGTLFEILNTCLRTHIFIALFFRRSWYLGVIFFFGFIVLCFPFLMVLSPLHI